jgi:hypothetical protein
VFGEHAAPSSPASTRTYFSLEPPKPTLTARRAAAPAPRAAGLDGLLADTAALAARRQVDGQRGLAHLGGAAAGMNGSLPVAPPPTAV